MNSHQWEVLHSQRRFCPKYPHEAVVQWVFRNFPTGEASRTRILDLGCGGGRHAVFLAQEGYRVTATDYSRTGLEETKRRTQEAPVETILCEADALPIPDESFEGIVCYGVLCYLSFERVARAVQEIHRVLAKTGKALIVTRTNQDFRFQNAAPLSYQTFRLKGADGGPADAEANMLMSALNRSDIAKLFRDFSYVSVDQWSFTDEGGSFLNDDWHIRVHK